MPNYESFSFVRRISQIGTLLQTALCGKEVGRDELGNRYFTERGSARGGRRLKRWALYTGAPEPTKIPPEWHAWLHYTVDSPLTGVERKSWQKPHTANMTGTPDAWKPANKQNSPCTEKCSVQAWKPE